jgi:hypothetical protein
MYGRYLSLLVGLLSCTLLFDQESSTTSWKGVLHGDPGSAINGAQIHLIGGQGEFVSETAADGGFQFPSLPPVSYQLVVAIDGVGHNASTPVELKPGSPSAVVTLSTKGAVTVTLVKAEATGIAKPQAPRARFNSR